MAMRRLAFYFPLNDADVTKRDTVFMKTPHLTPHLSMGRQQGYFLSVMRLVLTANAGLQQDTAVSKYCSAKSQGPSESVCSVCRKDSNIASELIQTFMKIQ